MRQRLVLLFIICLFILVVAWNDNKAPKSKPQGMKMKKINRKMKKLNKKFKKMMKEIKSLKSKIYNLKHSLKVLDKRVSPQSLGSFQGSTLLTKPAHVELLNGWYGNRSQKWKLLYKGTVHGFGSKDFHNRCNNQGETLIVVQTTLGYIFGAWTPVVWRSAGGYISKGLNSWIFSLVNPSNTPIRLFNTGAYGSYELYDHVNYGPTFGAGHDIYIANNANATTTNYSNLGHSYALPPNAQYGTTSAKVFLAGSSRFQVKEIEVFTPVY
jgi:hypothetical protein